jgi:DNA-binding transcriptional LysR family regulator
MARSEKSKTSAPTTAGTLELQPLRYFQRIAREGSLTAAAQALGLSQPTLSVALQNLEKHLGTCLLYRNPRGVTLTDTGKELLRYADEVFALLDRAEAAVRGLETEDSGRFVLGCHESLGAYFLPRVMQEQLRVLPRVQLGLWNGTSAAVRDAVLSRQIHFGLVVNPHPHPELVMVRLFGDAYDIYVASSEPQEDLAASRARLARGPLVLAGRINQSHELVDRLAALGLLSETQLNCGDLELVKSLVLSGLGVGLLPRRVADYGHDARLRRLHPDLPFVPDSIFLVWRSDLHRTKAALRVKDLLVAHGKGLDSA